MQAFENAFTDTMSVQRARAEFQNLKMEGQDLDAYVAKFERVARLARYDLQDQLVLDKFGSGLNLGLYANIVNSSEEPHGWMDWVRAAQKYQQKYLLIRAKMSPKDKSKKSRDTPRTAEQWKSAWKPRRDSNTMDTSADRARARMISADDRAELMKTGKCFTCRKQGHLSRDCPQ